MRLTFDFLGLCLDVQFGPLGGTQESPDLEPQGSTCGILERVPAWDHDSRPPLGFAGRET